MPHVDGFRHCVGIGQQTLKLGWRQAIEKGGRAASSSTSFSLWQPPCCVSGPPPPSRGRVGGHCCSNTRTRGRCSPLLRSLRPSWTNCCRKWRTSPPGTLAQGDTMRRTCSASSVTMWVFTHTMESYSMDISHTCEFTQLIPTFSVVFGRTHATFSNIFCSLWTNSRNLFQHFL